MQAVNCCILLQIMYNINMLNVFIFILVYMLQNVMYTWIWLTEVNLKVSCKQLE